MTSQLSVSTFYGLIKLLATCAAGAHVVAESLLQVWENSAWGVSSGELARALAAADLHAALWLCVGRWACYSLPATPCCGPASGFKPNGLSSSFQASTAMLHRPTH